MVRVGRPVIVRHVTSVACARCVVVVAIVTLVATDRGVRPHQWVTVVVIARWDPSCLIVALRAIRGELGRRMVRVGGAIVVRHVAGITVGRCTLVPIGMALRTGNAGVAPGQREAGRAMIKGRVPPGGLIVTDRAIRRELGRRMVRVGGAIVVRHVAGITVDRCTLVTVGVALRAVNADMAAGKWETRGRMIV